MPDMINRPPHYTHGNIEPIDVIEAWKLGFHNGNALKYIARCGHKDDEIQELKKAYWYLVRLAGMGVEQLPFDQRFQPPGPTPEMVVKDWKLSTELSSAVFAIAWGDVGHAARYVENEAARLRLLRHR